MAKQKIPTLQWVAWILALIAIAIIAFGIIRELFLK